MRKLKKKKKWAFSSKTQTILIGCLKTIFLGLVMSIAGNFLLQFFQNQYSFSLAMNFAFNWHTELFLFGAFLLFVLYIWMTSLFGSRWLSALILLLGVLVIGLTTQQKMALRGEPLYPSDFSMIRELPFLIRMIDSKLILKMSVFLLCVVSIAVFILVKKKRKNRWERPVRTKASWLIRGSTFLLASFILFYISCFNQTGNVFKVAYDRYAYWIPYSQQMNYYNNGFIGGFLYNLGINAMTKPTNYSNQQVADIVHKYEEKAAEINESREAALNDVNIIYVMNESFSDPLDLEGITLSKDPIPKIRELEKTTLSGKVLSQGYGGGTANIEFEALTGLSMEPMAASLTTPYTQLVSRMSKLPSIVSYLNQQNYATTAIHPYNTTMYKRNEVYQKLGFKTFLNETNMEFVEKNDRNPYISDQSAYQEVLKQMKNTKASDFIHLVSMQNHMSYSGKYPNTDFSAQGTGNAKEAANYLQDLEYSDDALDDFLTTIEQLPEKTIVVFWGDHLPSFYSESIVEANGSLKMHQTPLLIYSNFADNEDKLGTISPIYFMNHILTMANAQVTPFYALLMELEEELPAFEKGMYLESNTKKIITERKDLSKEAQDLLTVYDMIQYDVTVGGNYSQALNFFEN